MLTLIHFMKSLVLVPILLTTSMAAYSQNYNLMERDRNIYFTTGFGVGFTDYQFESENILVEQLNEVDNVFIDVENGSAGINGSIRVGVFVKDPLMRLTGSFHLESYRSGQPFLNFFPLPNSYKMEHKINVFRIKYEKLFWFEDKTYSRFWGVGSSYGLVIDQRHETFKYEKNQHTQTIRDQISFFSNLISFEFVYGIFDTKNNPFWLDIHFGYQFDLGTSVDKHSIKTGKEVNRSFYPLFSAIYLQFGVGLFL